MKLAASFAFILILLISSSAIAQTMSNNNYRLQINTKNTKVQVPNNPNYKVKSGFQNISTSNFFTFSISQTLIDFGILSPTNPVTRTNILTILSGSTNGYSVTAFENHKLSSTLSGVFIPDTTCDNGACSESNTAAWTNPLTYGFGYRCDNLQGTDCASGFSYPSFYKQFADASNSEMPQILMSGINIGIIKKAQITYKVNVSGTQQPGFYNNVINYIAVPNF